MILIKDIKILYTKEDIHRLRCELYPPIKELLIKQPGKAVPAKVTPEMVFGRIFRTATGEEICIGMTGAVQKAIGLPFEAFDNLQNELEEAKNSYNIICRTLNQQNKKLFTLQNMSWWQRLIFLFNKNIIKI